MTDTRALSLSVRAVKTAAVEVARSPTASLTWDELVACLDMVVQAEQDLGAVRQHIVQELTDRGIPLPDRARGVGAEYRLFPTADPSARST